MEFVRKYVRKPWLQRRFNAFKALALILIVALAASFYWNSLTVEELGRIRARFNQQIAQQTETIRGLEAERAATPAPEAGAVSDTVARTASAPFRVESLDPNAENLDLKFLERELLSKQNELLELNRTEMREELAASTTASSSAEYDRLGGEIEAQNRLVQALDFQIAGYRDQLTLLDLQEKERKAQAYNTWKSEDTALETRIEELRRTIAAKTEQSTELKSRFIEWSTVLQYRALDEEIARDQIALQELVRQRTDAEKAMTESQFTTPLEIAASREETQTTLAQLQVQRETEMGRLNALQQDLFQANDVETNRELTAAIRDTDRRRLEQEISSLQARINALEATESAEPPRLLAE